MDYDLKQVNPFFFIGTLLLSGSLQNNTPVLDNPAAKYKPEHSFFGTFLRHTFFPPPLLTHCAYSSSSLTYKPNPVTLVYSILSLLRNPSAPKRLGTFFPGFTQPSPSSTTYRAPFSPPIFYSKEILCTYKQVFALPTPTHALSLFAPIHALSLYKLTILPPGTNPPLYINITYAHALSSKPNHL